VLSRLFAFHINCFSLSLHNLREEPLNCTSYSVFTRGDRRGDDRLLVNTRGDGRHYDRHFDRQYDRRDDRLVYSLCYKHEFTLRYD